MSLFLFLIIVAIALGIIGATVDGLFYLLIIGIVVLVADLAYAMMRFRRRRRSSRHRGIR
jgi:membrane protein implicated in regulation of membrane protease activity